MIEVNSELIEHMASPKNYGPLKDYDAMGIGENPQNGEKVIVYIKVDESSGVPKIVDIGFEAIACMTTVVAGSIITNEARGVDFEMANELISTTLGMLDTIPPEDAACSEIVALALEAAIDTYIAKKENPKSGTIIYKIQHSCDPNRAHQKD
ncbi:MAG: iron-sulfur cluster assembly scaffold protein [Epsilonproteobacteria bacterium]|nr:iron-sulfur cluster assembly scaffold protein [Campylobacterota bacterium]